MSAGPFAAAGFNSAPLVQKYWNTGAELVRFTLVSVVSQLTVEDPVAWVHRERVCAVESYRHATTVWVPAVGPIFMMISFAEMV